MTNEQSQNGGGLSNSQIDEIKYANREILWYSKYVQGGEGSKNLSCRCVHTKWVAPNNKIASSWVSLKRFQNKNQVIKYQNII